MNEICHLICSSGKLGIFKLGKSHHAQAYARVGHAIGRKISTCPGRRTSTLITEKEVCCLAYLLDIPIHEMSGCCQEDGPDTHTETAGTCRPNLPMIYLDASVQSNKNKISTELAPIKLALERMIMPGVELVSSWTNSNALLTRFISKI